MKVDQSLCMRSRHRDLIAWQRADDLFVELHLLSTKSFPAFERFELGSQLRKAAYSSQRTSLKDSRDGIGAIAYIS